jgi:hypothetical protein
VIFAVGRDVDRVAVPVLAVESPARVGVEAIEGGDEGERDDDGGDDGGKCEKEEPLRGSAKVFGDGHQ